MSPILSPDAGPSRGFAYATTMARRSMNRSVTGSAAEPPGGCSWSELMRLAWVSLMRAISAIISRA